jgi:hypothetical protein
LSSPITRRQFLRATGGLVAGAAAVGVPFIKGSVPPAEAALGIWTGFHWCVPGNYSADHPTAQQLLKDSGRWGSVVMAQPSYKNPADQNYLSFKDACDRVMQARSDLQGGRSLDQCIVRLADWTGDESSPWLPTPEAADAWLDRKGFYLALDYFVGNGGRNAVIFNELNNGGQNGLPGEPQHNIEPLSMASLSYALQNRYWNGGNRLLYTLFPGPTGFLVWNSAGGWTQSFYGYWRRYDFLSGWNSPQTFSQAYAPWGVSVDPRLANSTMLWHNGRGVFDRLALHVYAPDPLTLRQRFSDNPQGTPYKYLTWTKDRVDATGYAYVTEVSGANSTDPADQARAGYALAEWEYNVNANYPRSFLQGAYGYVLEPTIDAATNPVAHKIGEPFISGANTASGYVKGYNARRTELGF